MKLLFNLHVKHSVWGSPAHPLGQRQTGLWDVVSQTALLPHGLWIMQGSKHWFSMQALLSGQSTSCWQAPRCTKRKYEDESKIYITTNLNQFLLGIQRLYGSPVSPGGHLQFGLWLSTVHSAVEAHGLSNPHGLTQALFLQAWLDEHSSSLEQPTSMGATKRIFHYKFASFKRKEKNILLILSQLTRPLPV